MYTLSRNAFIALDITDPTPYEVWDEEEEETEEEEPHEVLDSDNNPYICPHCGKPIMSDEYAVSVCVGEKVVTLYHSDCINEKMPIEEFERLEAKYNLYEDYPEELLK